MVVCCLAWGGGGGSPPACPPRAKGCLFHINLLSYRWLHLPRYQQRAPRQQQRPVRAPQHTFRDLQPLLQYLFLLGIAVAAPAGPGPEHAGLPAEAPPGTSRPPDQLPAGERWGLSAPLSPGLFRHPHVASKYAATACHRMPQRGGRPHTHRPPHRPRGHCPECEEFSARPVCQRRADCGEKILAVRRPIAEGAKDETARFHRGDDTGSLT